MRKFLTVVALGLTSLAAAAGTTTYTGTGTYQIVRVLLPLANGGAAIQFLNDTTATFQRRFIRPGQLRVRRRYRRRGQGRGRWRAVRRHCG